jgi:NAD(P)H-hydrate epimerase
LAVRLLQLGDAARLRGEALASAEDFLAAGGEVEAFQGLPEHTDLLVDGVFGTGLEREVVGRWRDALEAVNRHPAPVLALDIPSGLHADSGQALGVAVKARATISFIALKQGMFTAEGPEYCGDIHFDALEVPAVVYSREILSARRLDWAQQSSALSPRPRTGHKGDFGHLLVIGGDRGMAGAPRMAGEAAARTGAGLVTIATRPEHASLSAAARPELMCHGVEKPQQLDPLLHRASVVAIGPGLGQGRWGRSLLGRILQTKLPLVVDADALNLLAAEPTERDDWILTPHPGEAARLLAGTTGQIQADRFLAVARLQQRFGGVAVLKGSGTLIQGRASRPPAVCSQGNPGMASGGMGDVLTGVIGGLMAQGFEPEEAACIGVCLHAAAADRAAEAGERGLLAADLMPAIRCLVNPGQARC